MGRYTSRSGLPAASSARQPSIFSAARLRVTTRPEVSVLTTASPMLWSVTASSSCSAARWRACVASSWRRSKLSMRSQAPSRLSRANWWLLMTSATSAAPQRSSE
ncbi:MAG: hypothetical protein QM765_09120 [Myxococcales bacterium]